MLLKKFQAGRVFIGSLSYKKDFIENVRYELKDNVRRLRIHPSIILWNGNNEVEIGWKEWGW